MTVQMLFKHFTAGQKDFKASAWMQTDVSYAVKDSRVDQAVIVVHLCVSH